MDLRVKLFSSLCYVDHQGNHSTPKKSKIFNNENKPLIFIFLKCQRLKYMKLS